MKIEEAIKNRRSIRRYTKTALKESDIEKILDAARWAPSGLNNQPWKFKVITDKSAKDSLSKFTKCSEILKEAPLLICVFLDKSASYNREKDIMAIGACIQDMLLQAHGLGLATCWLGEILNKKVDVAKFLSINSDYELMAVITVGYPDETEKGERKELDSLLIR